MINNHTDFPQSFIKLPLVRQSTTYTCGVAALQSVLAYYDFFIREDLLTKEVHCTPDSGTPNWEIKRFVESNGFKCTTTQNMNIEHLEKYIDQNIPVIVAIQAWVSEDSIDWSNTWDHGHYVVVIGYDDDNYYFMDPSTLGYYTYIPKIEFVDRWHDVDQNNEKVIHLGLAIKGQKKDEYNPLQFKKLN